MATAGRSAMSAWEPAREPSPRAPHSRRPPDEQHLGRPRGGRVRVTRTPRRDPRIRPGQACGAAPRPHGSRGGRQGPQVSAAEQHDAPAPRAGAPALQEVRGRPQPRRPQDRRGSLSAGRRHREPGAPRRPARWAGSRTPRGPLGTAQGDCAAHLRAGRDGGAEDCGPLAAGQYPEYARRRERGIGVPDVPGRRGGGRVRGAHTAGQCPAGVRRRRARTSGNRTRPEALPGKRVHTAARLGAPHATGQGDAKGRRPRGRHSANAPARWAEATRMRRGPIAAGRRPHEPGAPGRSATEPARRAAVSVRVRGA